MALPLSAAIALWVSTVRGQTWSNERTTPALSELVAIDQSGETGWIFGAEDIARDGLTTFGDAEQAADVRSAYAALSSRRLWLRVYVSSSAAPDDLRVFAFIDSDRSAATGGSGAAPEIDATLTAGPSAGGYDVVVGIQSDPNPPGVWRWQDDSSAYEPIADLQPLDLEIETGTDRDPLGLGSPPNGYTQVALDVSSLGIPTTCAVNLLFRATNAEGLTDRDVGSGGPCIPNDVDQNGLPDIAEPDAGCSSDDQCPAEGECVDSRCVAPAGGAPCSADDDCSPRDRCIEGACRAEPLALGPDESVQGGALACQASSASPAGSARVALGVAWLLLVAAAAALRGLARRSDGGRA